MTGWGRAARLLAVGGFSLLLALVVGAQALPLPSPQEVQEAAGPLAADPQGAAQDPQGTVDDTMDQVLRPGDSGRAPDPMPPPSDEGPGFAGRIRDAFQDHLVLAGAAGVVATAIGLGSFAFVTRYVSPKEALRNPQRSMLYGFVRGNPGVHLKRLSEEFAMKTSSILWHMRKLEAAELVRSERANGFRVFYPVEGGIEMRRVSRGITALQNRNARSIFDYIDRHPGITIAQIASALAIHGGTVRWHLRKLRDFGLVEELVREDASLFYGTPLGRRSLHTLQGAPVDDLPPPSGPEDVLPDVPNPNPPSGPGPARGPLASLSPLVE